MTHGGFPGGHHGGFPGGHAGPADSGHQHSGHQHSEDHHHEPQPTSTAGVPWPGSRPAGQAGRRTRTGPAGWWAWLARGWRSRRATRG